MTSWRSGSGALSVQPRASQTARNAGEVDSGRVRATICTVPRLLSDRERDILDLLLSVDFPGAVELRQQAESVTAESEGMIVTLAVSAASPRATVVSRTPVQAVVDGDGYDGGLLLFVDEGRLSALEYWWVTEERPDVLPPLTAIGAAITCK